MFLQGLVAGGIKNVRVRPHRNVIAIDVMERSALERLTAINKLGDISVRPHIFQDTGTRAGVIYNVDMAICDADLPVLIKPASKSISII